MEKIWIKKQLYYENYEFLNILGISGFLFENRKNRKKRVYLPAGADVASGTSAQANVVCGTTARMQRGTKATWQGCGWPAQGAGGA